MGYHLLQEGDSFSLMGTLLGNENPLNLPDHHCYKEKTVIKAIHKTKQPVLYSRSIA